MICRCVDFHPSFILSYTNVISALSPRINFSLNSSELTNHVVQDEQTKQWLLLSTSNIIYRDILSIILPLHVFFRPRG